MKKPNTEQVRAARRLLAHEAQGMGSAEEQAAAAGRVHAKIFARLATLLGAGGARALYARSVRLTTGEHPCLQGVNFDAKQPTESVMGELTTCLRGEAPAVAVETAVALCAVLLALLTTLIGERLTFQVLRSAWPTFDVSDPTKEETNR
jgi:hypothetical protein